MATKSKTTKKAESLKGLARIGNLKLQLKPVAGKEGVFYITNAQVNKIKARVSELKTQIDAVAVSKVPVKKVAKASDNPNLSALKTKQTTTFTRRLKGALKEANLIKTGKIKPQSNSDLVKELRKIQKSHNV